MFLVGCVAVSIITVLVNVLLKKHPKKADHVINYIMYLVLAALLTYATSFTDWLPVEEKLSEQIEEYRETQRNIWK